MHTSNSYIPALGYPFLSRYYDKAISWCMPESTIRKKLADLINLRPGERLLDFGAGTASQAILLKQISPDAHVVGVDIDPDIIALAEKKIQLLGLQIEMDIYDGQKLPYSDASFDKAISTLVFHQLEDDAKTNACKELHRIIKPGGTLVIGDWGKSRHPGMRLAFILVQLLDGFRTTSSNVQGKLPFFIRSAGFTDVTEYSYLNTGLGTFSFYKAKKT